MKKPTNWTTEVPSGRWLDLNRWERRETFAFFLRYEQPLTNICATVDVGPTVRFCKERNESFFLTSWYLAMRAVASVENLRMRLRGDRVFVYDSLYVSTTVLREDESFGFCHIPLTQTFREFKAIGIEAIRMARAGSDSLMSLEGRDDAVYGTTVPWLRLTGVTHAHRIPVQSSVPKIVFGRFEDIRGQVTMPVALEVHHALCDGLHMSRFFQRFEALLQRPEEELLL